MQAGRNEEGSKDQKQPKEKKSFRLYHKRATPFEKFLEQGRHIITEETASRDRHYFARLPGNHRTFFSMTSLFFGNKNGYGASGHYFLYFGYSGI